MVSDPVATLKMSAITRDSTCPNGPTDSELVGARLSVNSTGTDCLSAATIQFKLQGKGKPLASMQVNILTPTSETASFHRSITFLQYACGAFSTQFADPRATPPVPPIPWSSIRLLDALNLVSANFGAESEYDVQVGNSDGSASFDGLFINEHLSASGNCPGEYKPRGDFIGQTTHNTVTDVNGLNFVNAFPCHESIEQTLNINTCFFPKVTLTLDVDPHYKFTSTRTDLIGMPGAPISIVDPKFASGAISLRGVRYDGDVVLCSAIPEPQ